MAPWPGGPGRDATDDDADADEDATIDDDEEEYEEAEGENRLLGFMFGNVDDAGDLDVDYLDEDAKEHLAALADKLGSSLKDIDLSTKSPQTRSDATNQDYHAKAENAVDYEDIDEEYEGPEIDNVTEEDLLLSKKEFTSEVVSITSLENTLVLDDENYDDEDDDLEKQSMATGDHIEVQPLSPSGFGKPTDIHEALPQEGSLTDDVHAFEIENPHRVNPEQNVSSPSEELADGVAPSLLPVLFVDNGNAILRFSEIFCIHETSKKARKRECQYMINRDKYMSMDACDIVEEDDELFLKAPSADLSRMRQFQRKLNAFDLGFQDDPVKSGHVRKLDKMSLGVDDYKNGSCILSEPMKDGILATSFPGWNTPLSPQFHPLNQEDWEERIVWDDSASSTDSFVESCELSGPDSDTLAVKDIDLESETEVFDSEIHHKPLDKANLSNVYNYACTVEPFDLEVVSQSSGPTISRSHPQLLRLESQLDKPAANVHGTNDASAESKFFSDAITRFSMLTLQNRDVVEGSWLDNITWEEQHKSVVKPKLILDLQDQKMLFELSDMVDAKHLLLHSGAMIISRSLQHSSTGDPVEQHSHGCFTSGRFNISNDKFYSNRKSSQQLRSHSKKRTIQGLKVLHSVPALKLQTMKTKLSNKDIANFHRPKALWYPHDIEVPFKEHGRSVRQGAMKIILKSLGSKGSKLHVDAEETISSVKAKASKKLDLKLSEPVKIFYSGRELEENKSLTEHDVQPNSVLHLIRTSIHQLPRAQKLPGENKSLRPPGAFKKKSDLSVKDGRVYLMEYCEERPLLLSNAGMGARLCTYYQKSAPADQTGNVLRNENSGLGSIITLDPADKSPFLGDIRPGSSQSCLETNMYRAPIFQHKVPSTDYLLVRSSKGKLSIRRIDRIDVVGQQEPHIEAMSPGSKGVQFYIMNRLLVYMYREFRASEKRGLNPSVRADELLSQFPSLSDVFLRKRLKNCADLQKGSNGHYHWVMKRNFRIPSEEELRRMVTPENVCAYESMQAGVYRLKRLGITKLTHPIGISSAMNQLPDEAIALAAASHIERELQITPWNLSSNFVACTNQDRENIERLEITGVGDPSGRGLGFSYVRATPKAPISNATLKKKTFVGKGSTVTGTDADLRRLSMEAARELLLKFNVPEEQIAKLTRWHRIAQIRKLSSEQAASGVKVDPTTVSKFARGQRMSFLQLQQQAREKCQEIWDRQVQSLCSGDAEENESESDANSDLDSFAGDLENLLDAEECEEGEEGNEDGKHENFDGVKGLKMRRRPLQTQAEEEIEDEAAEAAELCRILMDDDDADWRKKKKTKAVAYQIGSSSRSRENAQGMKKSGSVSKRLVQPVGSFVLTEKIAKDQMEVESLSAPKHFIGKLKPKKQNEIDQMGLLNKKIKIVGDGQTVIKEKKSARESFVCGACHQLGHMRTNKNCPKYGEDPEPRADDVEKSSGRPHFSDQVEQSQQKNLTKKLTTTNGTRASGSEVAEDDKLAPKAKILKVKCGAVDKLPDKPTPPTSQTSDPLAVSDAETGNKSAVKVNKIIFSNKMRSDDLLVETPRAASIVIKPPVEADRDQARKKIIIRQPKEASQFDDNSQDGSFGFEYRKTKKITELSGLDKRLEHDGKHLFEESSRMKGPVGNHWWLEEQRNAERLQERNRRAGKMRMLEEQPVYEQLQRYEEVIRREREEEELLRANAKKKKKRKLERMDNYLNDFPSKRNDKRIPELDRTARRGAEPEYGKHASDSGQQTKRRRAGEVGLSNILVSIVETLRARKEISYLFLKPVTRKEAPDYFDIISLPMDLSTIRDKARRMEYKNRDEFWHDVWLIRYNAHKYNDDRNPGIPPLADQLLELCGYLLDQYDAELREAEAGIE